MENQKNRAQVLYGCKELKLIEREIDPPGPEEVQIAIKSTTLCGSDIHYFNHFANGDLRIKEPLSQGHEAAGCVVALGCKVTNLKKGDRVAVEAGVPCGNCSHCQQGRYNVCPKIKFRSSAASFPHFQGTLQERINHPAKWCHLLPEDVSFNEGALLEPLSVAIHAARKADINAGSKCLIIGAGAIGLLCSAVAKYNGCKHVVLTDIAENRLIFAKDNKFAEETYTIIPKRSEDVKQGLSMAQNLAQDLVAVGGKVVSDQGGYDVVFECTGVESSVQLAIYSTRPSGSVLLVGMGTPVQTLPISAAAFKEVDLKGVWRYARTYPEALKVLEQSKKGTEVPDISQLITHTFIGLESVQDAFNTAGQSLDEKGDLVIKVVVQN